MLKALKLVIFFLIILLLTGCSTVSNKSGLEAFLNKSDDEIIIGVAAPFSSLKEQSAGYEEGLQMAVDEVNVKGLLGKKIRLVKEDDEASVTKGLAAAQAFSNSTHVSAVIGHINSRISIPAAAIYEEAGIVMVTPKSTSPKLTQKGYNYIFRQIPSDVEISRHMLDFARKSSLTRIAVFYGDDDYGRGLANSFEDLATDFGIKVVDRVTNPGSEIELRKVLERWKAMDFNAVLVADSMPEAARTIKGLRQAGITVPIIGGDGLDYPDFIKTAGPGAEGVVIMTLFNPDEQQPLFKSFIEKFKEKYGKSPDLWSMQGYETVKLIVAAIEMCGSGKPEKIADALRSMKDWDGLTGRISFDENGEVHGKAIYKKIVRGGKFEYLR